MTDKINVHPVRATSKVEKMRSVILERNISRSDIIKLCMIASDTLMTVHSLAIAESIREQEVFSAKMF